MASFNVNLLKTTWGKILQGENMIENLEMISQSNLPLALATSLEMETKLVRWIPYGAMGALCADILSKLKMKREEEQKKEEKKESRKRKSEEKKDQKVKKAKNSEEKKNSDGLLKATTEQKTKITFEEKENSEPNKAIQTELKTKKEVKKAAPKKVFAPLFKKCMRDRRNFRF